MEISEKELDSLKSSANGFSTLESFFETEPSLKEIYKETVDECLKDNCQSITSMMMLTIRKLMDYSELY